uniref:Uncharacterized protein n=1 Tax=Paramormyrops kingsleyae TaxID=1676925 RepID=A0A3B3Q4K5_9TELE
MAACRECGETVDRYRAEVERLTRELAEANREKIRAAECGLVVLEENQSLKQQYTDLEADQETLKRELERLQEVESGREAADLDQHDQKDNRYGLEVDPRCWQHVPPQGPCVGLGSQQ